MLVHQRVHEAFRSWVRWMVAIHRSEPGLSFEARQGCSDPGFLVIFANYCHRGNGWKWMEMDDKRSPWYLNSPFFFQPFFSPVSGLMEKHHGIKSSQMERFLMFSGYIIKFSCWVVSRISTVSISVGIQTSKQWIQTATMGHG